MKNWVLFLIVISLAIVLLSMVKWRDVMPPIEAVGHIENSFIISAEYSEVRTILTRTKSLPTIVEANNGKLIDQQWLYKDFNLGDRPIRDKDWSFYGECLVMVQPGDERTSQEVLELKQVIKINSDIMTIETTLNKPTKEVLEYNGLTTFEDNGNQETKVTNNLTIKISYRHLPIESVKNKIKEETQKMVESSSRKSEAAIQCLVNRHKGHFFIVK